MKLPSKKGAIYKKIKGFPLYRVCNDGSVWSFKMGFWMFLEGSLTGQGRIQVLLSNNKGVRRFQVHRLVLEAFVGPCPLGMQCCHWDDNPLNNKLSNLRWGTGKENMADRKRNGIRFTSPETVRKGETHYMTSFTEKQVKEIREERKTKKTPYYKMAARYGVSTTCIYHIVKRTRWKHVV